MGGFGDLLGGLIGALSGGGIEGVAEVARGAFDGDSSDESDPAATYERYLAGGPRSLNINDI